MIGATGRVSSVGEAVGDGSDPTAGDITRDFSTIVSRVGVVLGVVTGDTTGDISGDVPRASIGDFVGDVLGGVMGVTMDGVDDSTHDVLSDSVGDVAGAVIGNVSGCAIDCDDSSLSEYEFSDASEKLASKSIRSWFVIPSPRSHRLRSDARDEMSDPVDACRLIVVFCAHNKFSKQLKTLKGK